MSPDLTAAPYELDDDAIAWVRNTIDAMDLDEKVGQLFINLNNRFDDEFVHNGSWTATTRAGCGTTTPTRPASRPTSARPRPGRRCRCWSRPTSRPAATAPATTAPMVATPLQTASTPDTWAAHQMGLVGGRESRALGCNWAFTPIVDIHHNWRNTVVATRAFGNDHQTVIKYAEAFSQGVREGAGDRPIALCMKHFPGDGRDERDQHVVTSYNDCTVEEWDATYRKIWEWGIGAGIESIMVGHIMLPEYSRQLRPGIADADILPATVAPELLTDLLRDDLGFNGVILTDASLMVGLTSALPRERQMVQAITAGCDMILFFRNHDEDFGFVRAAVDTGEITAERLDDALTRILGLKAKLGLHRRAGRRSGAAGRRAGGDRLRGAPRDRGPDRRPDHRPAQGHRRHPAAGSGPAPAAPPLQPGKCAGLHRHRAGVQAGGHRGADRGRVRGQRLPHRGQNWPPTARPSTCRASSPPKPRATPTSTTPP